MATTTTSVGSSILSALGANSGIDTSALVTSLVSATRDPRQSAITTQQTTNNARISALASAVSSLDTFADALSSVLAGADYKGTPNSSNSGLASVSLLTGGTPSGLPAQMVVKSLASARVYASTQATGATGSTAVGAGTMTITTAAGKTATITVGSSTNNSFSGLASAINAANIGVTASVVTDAKGTRLVFKGETGAANDFTVTTSATDSTSILAGLNSSAMTSTSDPANAKITLDGTDYEYASNTIDDAIPYLRIELTKADPTSTVNLSMSQPTATMKDLLKEYVDAYNTLMGALNTATSTGTDSSTAGVLNGVGAVRDMKTQLSKITSTQLAATGNYKTLSDIGIATNRDGTLTLDTDALDKAMAADPEGITKMLNPTMPTADNPGLSKLMDTVRDNLELDNGSLKLAQARYETLADDLTEQLEKLDEDMADYETRLTSIYSAMQTKLSALNATQSYLQQQIDAWNKSDS
ncbi:flagellar filament capping protein FliD [Sphingobium sp. AP49]|uniref:flagellar filament capping protein FliD n=1 Tax=Sphingobium sp. AP49 TaxID=1144307 RepID=UPI00026EE7DF|nr:flagellar filament capping protein FliD [Sphingobium sp. AP49]WHO38259.1 flagellar filament capping protein FliD [Sphingobium sp. AP49]